MGINNTQDIIDSRDIIERIEELESDENIDETEICELKELQNVEEQASFTGDWEYGKTLIRDSYFKEYAQELAEDCGMIPNDLKWPSDCIDWDQAAQKLQYDYTSIDYDGVEYWIRNC